MRTRMDPHRRYIGEAGRSRARRLVTQLSRLALSWLLVTLLILEPLLAQVTLAAGGPPTPPQLDSATEAVHKDTPVLAAVRPSSAAQGQTLTVALAGRGTHWAQGRTTASFDG